MKCRDCKFKWDFNNTNETGKALCSFLDKYVPVDVEDDCHYISRKTDLKCGDCDRFGSDTFCLGQSKDDSAFDETSKGLKLCSQYIDKEEPSLMSILMRWMVNGIYDRKMIDRMLDDFEDKFEELTNQS